VEDSDAEHTSPRGHIRPKAQPALRLRRPPDQLAHTTPAGDHVVLRALPMAQRLTGTVGVQYLIWTARDADDLARVEEALKARGAFVSATTEQGVKVVEEHDPDNVPLLVVYPASPAAGLTAVPARTYGY
jgi:hypothetical protein